MDISSNSLDYQLCLICKSLSVITSDIKVEILGQPDDDEDEDQSSIIFLLATVLEIPQNEVAQQQVKLINQQLHTSCCEPCTKLIYSGKQIYKEFLELTRKFRKVQKQIVERISNPNTDDLHSCGTILSTSIHHGLLDFCRNFLTKHDFNGFNFPFVLNEIPVNNFSKSTTDYQEDGGPLVDKVKEEPTSENEDDDTEGICGFLEDDENANCQAEEDNTQDSSASSSDENPQTESDSDFELPPPKKAAKKVPIKKNSTSKRKISRNRKSPAAAKSSREPTRPKYKPVPPLPTKKSKFDLLYPNYPKRVRDPTTLKYHCLEPSCPKNYHRKTELERHVIIQHLQDNFYKCEEPNCGKSYPHSEQFQDHVSWHQGIPRWKCEAVVSGGDGGTVQCTEAFFNRRKLTRHVQKVHQKGNPFICELCGKAFDCQDNLTGHKFNKHTEKGKASSSENVSNSTESYICNYCGKTFKWRVNLATHINLVHEQNVGKFECQLCELKFRWKSLLKTHLWDKHDKFSLEGYQPPRRKIKVEEKAYQCEVKGCRMSYHKEETLKKHMEMKHKGGGGKEGGGTYFHLSCKYCGKGFHLRGKLEHHQIAHENKESKPYGCEVCGSRYATLPYLKMHRWNIHKIPMEKARKNK